MAQMKIFEEKCFEEFKSSQVKAKEFMGPIGHNIIRVPVRNRAQFEYCRSKGIEVFETEFRLPNGEIMKQFCFYITFEQAAYCAMP